MHTGEKPFVCQVCDRKFALKVNLFQHQATHASDATLSNLGENLLFIISMKAKNELYFGAENKKALMMPEEGEIWS